MASQALIKTWNMTYLSKDDMLAIQPRCVIDSDEELHTHETQIIIQNWATYMCKALPHKKEMTTAIDETDCVFNSDAEIRYQSMSQSTTHVLLGPGRQAKNRILWQ